MSPVTTTEAQRTAAQSGPFPGVGVGAAVGVREGDADVDAAVPDAAVPVAAGAAVVPAAAAEPDALFSGRAPMPQEATEAARETAAAAARRRPRSLGVKVRMALILRWRPSQHAQQAVENPPLT
jgi:hypothetical protein